MEHLRRSYIDALKAWNRVHRIIGARSKSPEQLVRESEEALRTLQKYPNITTIFDVGAGGGILGIPWLWTSSAQSRIGLIEPDLKKSSFLIHFRSTLEDKFKNRLLILSSRLEDVARETVDAFAKADERCFVARAFSGEVDLAEAARRSKFPSELFLTFSEESRGNGSSFVLEPVTV